MKHNHTANTTCFLGMCRDCSNFLWYQFPGEDMVLPEDCSSTAAFDEICVGLKSKPTTFIRHTSRCDDCDECGDE